MFAWKQVGGGGGFVWGESQPYVDTINPLNPKTMTVLAVCFLFASLVE